MATERALARFEAHLATPRRTILGRAACLEEVALVADAPVVAPPPAVAVSK